MSSHNEPQVAYPPMETQGGFMAPPPPAGYPTKDGQEGQQIQAPKVTTKSRGDGFWKGCCAALCCCCVLDACF